MEKGLSDVNAGLWVMGFGWYCLGVILMEAGRCVTGVGCWFCVDVTEDVVWYVLGTG